MWKDAHEDTGGDALIARQCGRSLRVTPDTRGLLAWAVHRTSHAIQRRAPPPCSGSLTTWLASGSSRPGESGGSRYSRRGLSSWERAPRPRLRPPLNIRLAWDGLPHPDARIIAEPRPGVHPAGAGAARSVAEVMDVPRTQVHRRAPVGPEVSRRTSHGPVPHIGHGPGVASSMRRSARCRSISVHIHTLRPAPAGQPGSRADRSRMLLRGPTVAVTEQGTSRRRHQWSMG